jgi:putative spermidine/putrescine transport system substrate-binding protein
MDNFVSRRGFLGVAAGAAGLMSAGSLRALAAGLPLPTSPVSLNIVDAAGNLALTQPAFNAYKTANPKLVSRLVFNKATAPELPGKIKAQQAANNLDIDMVIVGPDALSAGMATDMWVDLLGMKDSGLPDLKSIYLDGAWSIQQLAKGFGVTVTYYPSGPLLEYLPDKVKTPPKSTQELLDWVKQNPNKFIYAQPANSGPGRTFLMGLPYLLKDSNPKDPVKGWDKTWAYLKELHKYVEYYPGGTGAVMKELGEAARFMTVTTTGWDINPRVLGAVPKEAKVAKLDGFHWVCDGHYLAVPKGLNEQKLAVVLDLIAFLLKPEQQAVTYDQGYFYPGPAVKGVTIDMAPAASQQAIAEFGRPEYADWIANNPVEAPLEPDAMVTAFHLWDQNVSASPK